jgi:hypothetical protein
MSLLTANILTTRRYTDPALGIINLRIQVYSPTIC